jgi:hypothetical protein
MDQQHLLPEPLEPVTALEVRALVERFGERQSMALGQPTVKDVAEALQVDPATVGQMLYELRESKNQGEIKTRLDNLERENAELRARAVHASAFHTPFADPSIRKPFMAAMVVAIVIVAMGTKAVFGEGRHVWGQQFIAIALLAGLFFVVGRGLFLRNRR